MGNLQQGNQPTMTMGQFCVGGEYVEWMSVFYNVTLSGDYYLLGYDVMQSDKSLLTFQMNKLYPSSGLKSNLNKLAASKVLTLFILYTEDRSNILVIFYHIAGDSAS
jgi:hypothetical protein